MAGWKERLLNKDTSTFKKFIESTTVNGVVRIFEGKSIIRRVFWLIIILAATGGCLYNVSNRIQFLISHPTSTTVSITRSTTLTFPAVTVCNLNSFRSEALNERNLADVIDSAIAFATREEDNQRCEARMSQSDNLNSITFEDLTMQAGHSVEDLILHCSFAGEACDNITEIFKLVFTKLGICYTFNLGFESPLQSKGTGQRHGLHLIVNVDQSDYATPFDAGVKVAIHTQSEPPLPDDQGIGVPPGMNTFISIKEKNILDKTGRDCKSPEDLSNLNFLQGEYSTYSVPACLVDCIHTKVADNYECIVASSFYSIDTPRYSQLPNCTLEKLCCIEDDFLSPNACDCPTACSSISYETTVSYSQFPADYISNNLASFFNVSAMIFPTNFLQISIYFETLNIDTETTNSAYSFIALLSDIGGQLGLFLGLSIISIMEFGTWLIDEIKNRVFGLSEDKLKHMFCSKCQKDLQTDSDNESEAAHGPSAAPEEMKVI